MQKTKQRIISDIHTFHINFKDVLLLINQVQTTTTTTKAKKYIAKYNQQRERYQRICLYTEDLCEHQIHYLFNGKKYEKNTKEKKLTIQTQNYK